MPASITRRAAFGGAAAVVLGSCGGGDPPPNGKPQAGSGAGVLNEIVALEQAAVAAWTAIGAVLPNDGREYAKIIRARKAGHVERVSALVRDLGGTPPEPLTQAEYLSMFPRLDGQPRDALRFASDLERRLVRAHLDALTSLPEVSQRRVAAQIAAEESQDLAVVRVLAGRPAAGQAFVTGVS